MNGMDIVVEEIKTGSRFRELQLEYSMELLWSGSSSALIELSPKEGNKSDKLMLTAEILDIVDKTEPDEEVRQEVIDYELYLIEQRMEEMKKLPSSDYMVRYRDDDVSLKWHWLYTENGEPIYFFTSVCEKMNRLDLVMRTSNGMSNISDLTKNLGSALKVYHDNNIFHNNISADNVYLSSSGTYLLGRIGINNDIPKGRRTDNRHDYSRKADIYMLGKTLSAVNGKNNTGKSGSGSGNKKIDRIINKACAEDVNKRYRSVDDILRDMDRKSGFNPVALIVASVVIVAAAAGVIFFVVNKDGDISENSVSEPVKPVHTESVPQTTEETTEVQETEPETTEAAETTTEPETESEPTTFVYIETVGNSLGDINGDGTVNEDDAALLSAIYLECLSVENPRSLKKQEIDICDVTGDGRVDQSDAARVNDYCSYVNNNQSEEVYTLAEFVSEKIYMIEHTQNDEQESE